MSNFAKFLKVNGLKRKDIASFLGVSGAFITQISNGDRPLPEEKLAMIKTNAYGWDISMLITSLEGIDRIREPRVIAQEQLRSAVESVLKPSENDALVDYLKQKVEDQDALIRELYQQIGMLEAKLDLARKGETANAVGGSLSADVI